MPLQEVISGNIFFLVIYLKHPQNMNTFYAIFAESKCVCKENIKIDIPKLALDFLSSESASNLKNNDNLPVKIWGRIIRI